MMDIKLVSEEAVGNNAFENLQMLYYMYKEKNEKVEQTASRNEEVHC